MVLVACATTMAAATIATAAALGTADDAVVARNTPAGYHRPDVDDA